MFQLDTSISELALRAILIYFSLLFLFRIAGKKQLGQMSPFDLLLILIISEAVSGALIAEEFSLWGGLISAAVLIGTNFAMDDLTFRLPTLKRWLEGEPQVLIRDGTINKKVSAREKISEEEVCEALREFKIEDIKEVRIAYLETNGRITAFLKKKKEAADA